MKEIFEAMRNGSGAMTIEESDLSLMFRNDALKQEEVVEAISDYTPSEMYYPEYMRLGVSVFESLNGRISKVPSMDIDAEFVNENDDLPLSDLGLKGSDYSPRRVGFVFPVSNELLASTDNKTLMAIVKAGVKAVNEEILADVFLKALEGATAITETGLSRDTFIALQNQVGSDGLLFGGKNLILNAKAEDALTSVPLATGNVTWGYSWDGLRMRAAKKISDSYTYGYGDFKHAVVVEYSGYQLMIDRITRARLGETVLTFSKMVDTGITNSDKFAISVTGVPIIERDPSGLSRYEGETIVLSADAIGGTTYQWKKGGVVITGETSLKLVMENVTTGDSGDYTLTATNSSGDAVSAIATVVVIAQSYDYSSTNATPTALAMMENDGIDPTKVTGTGSAGRILVKDVDNYINDL